MKKILTILSFVFIAATLSAQVDISQNVLASGGGFDVSGDNSISLSWTLGELAITTVTSIDASLTLTQGFQQSKVGITAIRENPALGINITIYPNPTSEIINIRFTAPLEGETSVYLAGPDGRTIFTDIIPSGMMFKPIDMQAYPAGTYFLRIQNGIKLNVYKVIKL